MDFETVYHSLFKRVLAYVRCRVHCDNAAQDVCSRIWQLAWDRQSQYSPAKGLPAQWVFTIARNEVNKYFRSYYIKRFFSLDEETTAAPSVPGPLETLAKEARRNALAAALGCLNSRERDLISLKFYSGLNNRQIAALTGLGESNVGTVLSRAVNKLRERLESL